MCVLYGHNGISKLIYRGNTLDIVYVSYLGLGNMRDMYNSMYVSISKCVFI